MRETKTIRAARCKVRGARRSYWLALLAVLVGGAGAVVSLWSAVVGRNGAAAGAAFLLLIWTAGWLTAWAALSGELDSARGSLADAIDDEQARLTREAERTAAPDHEHKGTQYPQPGEPNKNTQTCPNASQRRKHNR